MKRLFKRVGMWWRRKRLAKKRRRGKAVKEEVEDLHDLRRREQERQGKGLFD